MEEMVEAPEAKDSPAETKQGAKAGLPPWVKILLIASAVGLGLLILAGVVFSFATGLFFKRALQQAGVKTNLGDLQKGKLNFTDTKTGTTVEIGGTKLPDNFPKDFPLYPGATLTGSVAGGAGGKGGFWLTFSTADNSDKVTAYFKDRLPASGWSISSTIAAEGTTTWGVSKGSWEGTLSVTHAKEAKETTFVVILGTKEGSTRGTSGY